MPELQTKSLSETPRDHETAAELRRMWESGEPVSVTINGGASLTIADTEAYRRLVELVDYMESVAAIRQGMQEIEEGQGLTLEQAKEAVYQKYGLSL